VEQALVDPNHVLQIGNLRFIRYTCHGSSPWLVVTQKPKQVLPTLELPFSFVRKNPYVITDIEDTKLLTSGPRLDPSECIRACGSNGRIFYTGQGGGLQTSLVCRPETATARRPWLSE